MKTAKQILDELVSLTTDLMPEESRDKYEELYGKLYTEIDEYEDVIEELNGEIEDLRNEVDGLEYDFKEIKESEDELENELEILKSDSKEFIPQTHHDEMKIEIVRKVMKHLNLNQVEQIEKEFNLKDKV